MLIALSGFFIAILAIILHSDITMKFALALILFDLVDEVWHTKEALVELLEEIMSK